MTSTLAPRRARVSSMAPLAVAALVLLGLAACGGDGGNDLVGRAAGTTSPTAVATVAATSAASGAASTAPGGDPATTTADVPVGGPLDVIAVEYKFELPAVIPKDATSIRLVNDGKEDHELLIGRMNDGVTLAQVEAATNLKALVPQTITLDAKPGQAAEMAIDVTAGNWFMACYLTTADGRSHAQLGMMGTFTAP